MYYRRRTDYSRAAAQMAEVLSTNASMVEIGRGITRKLVDVLHLKKAAVLFFREDGACCCQEAEGVDPEAWRGACEIADGRFVEAVQKFTGEFRVDYLVPALKKQFVDLDFQFVIPIRSKDRLIGTILIGEKRSEAPYSRDEMEFLSTAARHASVAIENAFLYEELAEKERMKHELLIARRIQLASLPQSTPVLEDLDVAGISLPAREVGGDFYDFLVEGKNRVTVVVGDVSGKGTSAALYMAKVQGILRSLHAFNLSPTEMFSRANRLLCADLDRNSFVTAVSAVFDADAGTLLLARAGHPPLYTVNPATGEVLRLAPRGLGLGLSDNGVFTEQLEERRLTITPGSLFLFVTDGVTDTRNAAGEEFGEERLLSFLRNAGSLDAAGVRDALLKEMEEFTGGREADDDRTVVVVRVGKSASVAVHVSEHPEDQPLQPRQ
jgi:serine phosphatase RsbU (regulator of sigma subunit)